MKIEKKYKMLYVLVLVQSFLLIIGGISYAYFTASVSTINDQNKTTNIHTVEFASATMDLGDKVVASNVLPGYKEIKTVTVVGDGKENTRSITAKITLTPNVVSFANHIKYTLYESDGIKPVDPTTICTASNPINNGNAYYDEMTCNTANLGAPILSGIFNGSTVVEKEIVVTSDMQKTYYLLIEYLNDETTNQDQEQGKEFTVTIGFTAGDNVLEYRESILNGADPVLAEGLIPVKIDESGNVSKVNIEEEWYNYENKVWANAVKTVSNTNYQNGEVIPESDIESYFVWVPRYKYKVFSNEAYGNLTSVTESKVEQIDIIFESKDVLPSTDTTKGSYLTHPAFVTMNTNGLWVGKFETGYKGATSTTNAEVNSEDASKVIIKPNVYSWRNIQPANAFYTSYNYLRNLDSHMMKNTEWGAVAYLTNSKYGRCSDGICEEVRINNNSNYITGYAAKNQPTIGYTTTNEAGNVYEGTALGLDGTNTYNYKNSISQNASSTGNYSGIYDLSGGAWDYVMGVLVDQNLQPLSGINASYNSGFKGGYSAGGSNTTGRDFPPAKYYDSYLYGTSRSDFTRYIYGDATGELGPFANRTYGTQTRQISSWYDDEAFFVFANNPWIKRGGHYVHGTGAGVSAFGTTRGSDDGNSFRVVLAV